MPDPFQLDDTVAVITGGANGIGLACAEVLGKAGAKIAVLDVDDRMMLRSVNDLRSSGLCVSGFTCDVGIERDVNIAVEEVMNYYGHIDILVNNAGTHDGKGLEATTEVSWDDLMMTNLRGVFLVTQAFLPSLKLVSGRIINIGSMVGLTGQYNSAAYSASKGGLIALTKSMALDLATYGIRVNCVCPGWIDTPLLQKWLKTQPDPSALLVSATASHPLGAIGQPADVAYAVLYLSLPISQFLTGIVLPVDGGVTLGY